MELTIELVVILTLLAFVAGLISAIAGAGGMIVLPLLLAAGLPPLQALATNKFQSVFGTASSTVNFFRRGHIDFAELRWALACAFIAAVIGSYGVQKIDSQLLEAAIPYALIAVALYMLLSPRIADHDNQPRMAKTPFDITVAGGLGFYGGVFGPGMGSFFAVAFAALRGCNMRRATANTKPLVLIINITAMVVFMVGGLVYWPLAIPMALAQILGARVGSNWVISRGAGLVKPAIITVTLIIAVKLLLS